LTAHVDPDRIRQVVDNLISNAIKYNRQWGAAEVSLSPRGEEIHLAFEDTGREVAEEDRAKLFTRFFRGDWRRTGTYRAPVSVYRSSTPS
jgi:two-component system phosphate regulon sensor histidine kinase PhoR